MTRMRRRPAVRKSPRPLRLVETTAEKRETTNAAGRIRDHLLRRRHDIILVENRFIDQELFPLLAQAREEVEDTALSFFLGRRKKSDTIAGRLGALRAQYPEITGSLQRAYREMSERLGDRLLELTVAEYEDLAKEFNALLPDYMARATTLPADEALAMARAPGEREAWSAYLDKHYRESALGIRTQLSQSILLGEGIPQAAARLQSQFGIAMRAAETLARTEIMGVSNAAHRRYYRANADIVKGLQHCATLDDRTCPQCGLLDGEVYRDEARAPILPVHPNCRCVYTPVLKSWRELGISVDEDPGWRASMDGYVPSTLRYRDWFDMQSEEWKRRWLGPTRYRYYREKGLAINKLFNPRGRHMTIDKLKTKYGALRGAA